MRTLPAGTVTFVFTDIEGSTALFHRLGHRYASELEHHNRLVGDAIREHGGVVIKTEGDSFFAAFDDARAAVRACIDAQRALAGFRWPQGVPVRVRIGLHTGPAVPVDDDYVALAVNQAARVSAAAHGEQIVVSAATAGAAGDPAWQFERLGEYRLRGFESGAVLFQVRAAGLRSHFPPLRVPGVVHHNLPALPAPLVGRDDDLRALHGLLRDGRLVTLVGPGGVGKTSLAIASAESQAPRFPGGAWWVDLAAVRRGDLVPEAIGAAVGVLEGAGPVETRLEERLFAQPTLVVLDNCEHLVAAAVAILDRLLDRCPDLTVVATSREPLGQRKEIAFDLQPLREDDAVGLLADRAAGSGRAAIAGEIDAAGLTEIARRLGGLPLALELVGAQLGERSPAQVLEEMCRTDVRAGSALLDPAMRASLAWSYDLLDDEAAACFRRLSVFAGVCTLEAAAAVCALDDRSPVRTAEILLDLADRSLVQVRRAGGRRRLRMLESVRAFAGELATADDGDEPVTVERHLAWYLALAEGASGVLEYGPARLPEAERLSPDIEDLQAALSRAAGRGDGAAALTIGRTTAAACTALARVAEARICFEETIAVAPALHPDRARATADLAGLLFLTGEHDDAEQWAREAARLAATSGASHAEALALGTLARLAEAANELDRAESTVSRALDRARGVGGHALVAALATAGLIAERRGDGPGRVTAHEEALAVARRVGDPRLLALTLTNLAGVALDLEDHATAEALLHEAVDLSAGDARSTSGILAYSNLGYLAFRRGDLEEARRLNDKAVADSRAAGWSREVAMALNNVAEVALAAGDVERARTDYAEALRLGDRLGQAERVCYCLDGLAAVAGAQGDHRRAVELVAFAVEHRRAAQVVLPRDYLESNEQVLVAARDQIGPGAFADAWRVGSELDLESAIRIATVERGAT